MSKPDESLWLGNRRNIVVVLRLIVFSIIYLIILQERALGELPPVFWVATGAFLLSEIVCLFEYKNYFLVQRVLGWIFVFDAALISLLIYLLGVKSGQLFIGYFAVIAIAAISRSVLASFIITFLVSAFYLFSSMNAGNFTWPEFLTRTLFFFGVAIFASYLSQEVSSQREEKERVEKILEHSEEKYLNLLANPLAGIYQSTLDGEFIYANPALADMLGYASPKELMLVKTPDTYANPARRTDFVNLLKKRGSVSSFENELKTKTGQVRYVLTSGKLEGEVISGVIMDITKRKEMEQTLCRNEERYRTIVDNTENLITWVDKDGKFLFVNHAAKHILGLKPEECLGKSAFDFSHPDDKQPTIDAFQKWLDSKEDAFYFENRQVSVKGNVTQMSWIIKALRDDKKNVTGFLSVAHDITRRKRAAEALLESQRQIEFILGAAKTELDIIDREFNLRYVDPECVKRSGDWKNRKCYEYYMGRDKPCSNCNAPKVFETKQILESEDALADDKNTYTHVTNIPYQDKSGEWLVAQVNVDITDRKRADINLKDSEARFRGFFDSSSVGMIMTDLDAQFSMVNPAACRMLGYTEKELLNKTFADITYLKDQNAAVAMDSVIKLLDGSLDSYEAERRYIRKDKQLIWGHLNMSVVRDEQNNPSHFICQLYDITERKRAAEALTASELRYRRLFEAAKDGILILDFHTGQIVDANKFLTDLLGFSLEQLLGKELWQVGFFKDIVSNKENFKELQLQKYIRYENLPLETAQGKKINVEFVSNVYDVDHTRVIQCNIRDITERKQAEEELEAKERQLSQAAKIAKLGYWELDIASGIFTFTDSFYDIFRTTAPEAGGYKMSIADYARRFVHPDDMDMVAAETKKAIETNDPGFNRQVEHRIIYADGKIGYITVRFFIVKDAQGKTIKTYGVNQDITERKQAEELLVASEARFKTFFENAPIGMSVLNMQGRYVRVNQSFCTTLGYTPEELYNIGYAKLTHPDDLAVSKEAIDLLLSNKAANRTFNKRYFHKNGSMVWAELNTSLLHDAAGQPLYFLVQIKDITERKQAEESLKMQAELLDSSTDSIILHDDKGRFVYANKAAYQTRGYTKEEFMTMTLSHLDTPECAKLIESRMKQITKTGRGRFEVDHRCKDGSIIPVESNVSILNMGNKPYFLAVWRDMTERNQVQEQTRRTSDTQAVINTLLNLSLQNIPLESVLNETLDIILSVPWLSHQSRGAIFLVDEKSHKLEMKIQRDIDPFLIKECAAVPLGRCLCGKAAMEQKTQFARSVDKAHEITYKGIIPHGHYCVPIHTRDRILGVLNIYLKDGHSYNQKEVDFLETITKTLAGIISRQEIVREKEGVQAQLLQAQKMEAIGFLSGGIAHDFNNILAAVRGYAELSLMDIDTTNPLYENLAHVVSASDRGKNLTNQLLLFSRKKSMNPKACDLNEILGNLLKMLNRLIGENFHIEPQLEKTPWRINADAGNLEQVIMNLALNARDAMPKGGRITIRTENTVISKEYCAVNIEARPGNFVCLSVADTGTGMTKEVLSHIFEPFFTTKEQGKGTGLGLPVVYGIVKQHQGWIEVDSKPGGGSVFKIYLPASDETAQSKPATRIISPADFKGQGERILVVEDDVDVRKLVISVLGRMNYQVFPAGSLAEARQVFDREKGEFHMILSDMSLPDGNGLEICDELTARNKNIKIILSSGYPSREENRDVIRQRGLPFIAKPYNLTLLFKTVREVLEQKAE